MLLLPKAENATGNINLFYSEITIIIIIIIMNTNIKVTVSLK